MLTPILTASITWHDSLLMHSLITFGYVKKAVVVILCVLIYICREYKALNVQDKDTKHIKDRKRNRASRIHTMVKSHRKMHQHIRKVYHTFHFS